MNVKEIKAEVAKAEQLIGDELNRILSLGDFSGIEVDVSTIKLDAAEGIIARVINVRIEVTL